VNAAVQAMLVLFETPAGFSLFKVLDDNKLKSADDIWKEFQTPESAKKAYVSITIAIN